MRHHRRAQRVTEFGGRPRFQSGDVDREDALLFRADQRRASPAAISKAVLSLADELRMLPVFQRLPAAAIGSAATLWSQRELLSGDELWRFNAPVEEIGVLLSGDLRAVLNGAEVGRVVPGELVGEAAGFFTGGVRSASLVAAARCKMAILPVAGLRTLRWQRSPLYGALLDAALVTLAKRIAAANQRITAMATGREAAPVRSEPALLARLWRALVPGGPAEPCPDSTPLLAALPGLAEAGTEVLRPLRAAFAAEAMTEGKALFLEGEPATSAFIVASGTVDVLRNVRGDRAERLATLKAGDVLGINTLITPGPRTASCVPASGGWLWRMDREAYESLTGDTRLWWRESMLGSLATQIRLSNLAVRRDASREGLKPPEPKTADSFSSLLEASGFLEGLPMNENSLGELQVVVTEDQRRNPRRR